jgi:hypothetical protein
MISVRVCSLRAAAVMLSVVVGACGGSQQSGGDQAEISASTTVYPAWSRCDSVLSDGWPDHQLGLVNVAEPFGLSDFFGIENGGTVCTASGPQGQLLWLVLTDDGRMLTFREGPDGSPVPAPAD